MPLMAAADAIPGPAFDIQKAQGSALGAKRHRIMHHQAPDRLAVGADRAGHLIGSQRESVVTVMSLL